MPGFNEYLAGKTNFPTHIGVAIKNLHLHSACTINKSGLVYEEYTSLSAIESKWDSVLDGPHCLNSKALQALQNAQPADMEFRYLLLYHEDSLCGVLYLQLLTLKPDFLDKTLLGTRGMQGLKKVISRQFQKVLVCGNLFRVRFPGFYIKSGIPEERVFDVLLEYEKHSRSEHDFCGIMVKDCLKPIAHTGRFSSFDDDVTMELDLVPGWEDFDAYRLALTKKYRQRCQKIRRAGAGLHIMKLDLSDVIREAERINQLYLQVALKQRMRIGLVNAGYFIELKKCLGNQFELLGYYLNGELVAFSTYIFYPDQTMEVHFIGMDYRFNESHCLYFNILFKAVEDAITYKAARLELGRTARVAKASLGAKPVKNHNYIYLKRGLPSIAFHFIRRWFLKEVGDDWQERSPFR